MENKEGCGVIFPNKFKDSESKPNQKGTVRYLGKDLEIALWDKTDKNGNPYYSVKLSEPWKKKEQPRSREEDAF